MDERGNSSLSGRRAGKMQPVTGHARVRTRKTRETARDVCFDANAKSAKSTRDSTTRSVTKMPTDGKNFGRLQTPPPFVCATVCRARAVPASRRRRGTRAPPKLDPNLADAPLTRRRQPWCRDRRTLRGCRRRSRRSRGPPPRPRRRCGGGRSARGCGGEPVARGGKRKQWSASKRLRMKTLARGETRRGGVPGRDARGGETHVTDALGPDSLVELHVNAHVRGLHGLLGELLHLCVRERGGWGQRCFLARDDGWKKSRRRVRRKTGPRRRSEGRMRRDNAGARSARVASRSCTSRRRRGAVARPRTPANARAVALENRACSVAGKGRTAATARGALFLKVIP